MEKYIILEHTADLKIKVFGKSKKELFSNALLSMIDNMQAETENGKLLSRTIKIKSPDLKALLVDFLSDILYLTQVNKEIYSKIKFKKFSNKEIEAELSGQKVKRFGQDIKAATYHSLEINKDKSGFWKAIILFDI